MPLLPYRCVRPFLFGLAPEAAHDLTMNALALTQHTPFKKIYSNPRVEDPVNLAGLHFPNRVGLAAGLDKNGRCIAGLAAMGFGFIEIGTVTPLAQPGNPKPRMFRLSAQQALINRLGFNNAGLDAFIANVKTYQAQQNPSQQAGRCLLGLNIGKNASTSMEQAVDDYLAGLNGVYPHADYVTINISSPNTANLRTLQTEQALDTLLAAMAERREVLHRAHGKKTPIFLKIAPDLDAPSLQSIANALLRHGMDGVIATNTTLNREAVQGLPHATQAGGLSGKPLLQASNQVIAQLRAHLGLGFPIIGVGGIMDGDDAVSKIAAGANAVQFYTGLIYKGPELVYEAALALKRKIPLSKPGVTHNPC